MLTFGERYSFAVLVLPVLKFKQSGYFAFTSQVRGSPPTQFLVWMPEKRPLHSKAGLASKAPRPAPPQLCQSCGLMQGCRARWLLGPLLSLRRQIPSKGPPNSPLLLPWRLCLCSSGLDATLLLCPPEPVPAPAILSCCSSCHLVSPPPCTARASPPHLSFP